MPALALVPLEDRAVPAAYALDPGFVSAQVALNVTGPSGVADADVANIVEQIVPLPDGGALVSRTAVFFGFPPPPTLTRLDAAGRLVTSFGDNGTAVVNPGDPSAYQLNSPEVVALPDGKILVGANAFFRDGSSQFFVARLNADGTPDATFGTNGQALVSDGAFGEVALQPDGRVVLAGTFPAVATATLDQFGPLPTDLIVVRLNADGTRDATFGPGGSVVLPTPDDRSHRVADLFVTAAGRIVLAGVGNAVNASFFNESVTVTRLLPDGRPDPAFDADGSAAVDLGGNGAVYAGTAVRPDGRIVVGAYTDYRRAGDPSDPITQSQPGRATVAQLTAAGAPDTAFGNGGGRFTSPEPQALDDLALDGAGRVVLAGDNVGGFTLAGGGGPVGLARLAADGSRLVDDYATADGPAGAFTQLPDLQLDANGRVFLTAVGPRTPVPTVGELVIGDGGTTSPVRVARFVPPADPEPPLPPPPPPLPPPPRPVGTFSAGVPSVVSVPDGRSAILAGVDGFATEAVASASGVAPSVTVSGRGVVAPVPFAPFEAAFTGGVYLASADFNADDYPDLIVTGGDGGGAVVAVYDGLKLAQGLTGDAAQLVRFYGIPDTAFRGGTRATTGDVTGDGVPDLIVAAGVGGGPRVTVWDGRSVGAGAPARVADFFAFEETFRNGVSVAAGDTDGDGVADLLFGAGPGGGPRVREFSGAALFGGQPFGNVNPAPAGAQRRDEFAGDPASRAGAAVRFDPAPIATTASPAPTLRLTQAADAPPTQAFDATTGLPLAPDDEVEGGF